MLEFKYVDHQEAIAKQYPGCEGESVDEYDFTTCLYEFRDGIPIRLLGMDCLEPKYNTFGRGWNWVADELNKLANVINTKLGNPKTTGKMWSE